MKSPGSVQACLPRSKASRQSGVGLIEVMIAVLILAIGLLGLASMQTNGIRMNNGSMSRSQAVFLANDIAERARANREFRASYVLPAAAVGSSNVGACSTTLGFDPAKTVAVNDMDEWLNSLACLLPSADATIQLTLPANRMRVTINWESRNDDADDGFLSVETQL